MHHLVWRSCPAHPFRVNDHELAPYLGLPRCVSPLGFAEDALIGSNPIIEHLRRDEHVTVLLSLPLWMGRRASGQLGASDEPKAVRRGERLTLEASRKGSFKVEGSE